MRDPRCIVEVGIHPGPFWRRRTDGVTFCDRHAQMLVEDKPWTFDNVYIEAFPEATP